MCFLEKFSTHPRAFTFHFEKSKYLHSFASQTVYANQVHRKQFLLVQFLVWSNEERITTNVAELRHQVEVVTVELVGESWLIHSLSFQVNEKGRGLPYLFPCPSPYPIVENEIRVDRSGYPMLYMSTPNIWGRVGSCLPFSLYTRHVNLRFSVAFQVHRPLLPLLPIICALHCLSNGISGITRELSPFLVIPFSRLAGLFFTRTPDFIPVSQNRSTVPDADLSKDPDDPSATGKLVCHRGDFVVHDLLLLRVGQHCKYSGLAGKVNEKSKKILEAPVGFQVALYHPIPQRSLCLLRIPISGILLKEKPGLPLGGFSPTLNHPGREGIVKRVIGLEKISGRKGLGGFRLGVFGGH